MAIWTVNTTADDGSVDTTPDSPTYRTGTLRGIIGAAASGDTITFDDALEDSQTGVITIYLDLALSISQGITIDGGDHWLENGVLKTRVVLDRQEGANVILNYSNVASIKDLTLCNTKGGSALDVSAYDITLDYCVVSNCASANGGAVNARNNATVNANNSLFTNCTASNNGGACYQSTSGHFNFTNCEFSNCSARNGGGVILYATNNTFTSCKFNNNTSAVNGSDLYINDNASANIINCLFLSTSANSVYNKSAITILGNVTTYKINTLSGSSVTFFGVDSILAVTETATIVSATFTAAEGATGYIALPAGTATPTVGENVFVGEYGANVLSISATIREDVATIDVSAGDPSKTYIVEASSDGGETWTQIALVDKKTTLTSAKAYIFRTFDGHFVTSSTIPRVYYYNGSPTAGSFAAAADWTLDEARTIVCPDSPTIADGVFYCV